MKKLIASLAILGSLVASAIDVTEVKVKVLDGFGGDSNSVLSRCQTKAGKPYDPITITRDVNSLKEAGELEEVNAEVDKRDAGVVVTFVVRRKLRFAGPLIVHGCDEFSESKVAKEAELKDGYLYGEADIAAAAAKVRTAYQKKYYSNVSVRYSTKVIGGNDVQIIFDIDEGSRRKISEYLFEGAEHAVDVSLWRKLGPSFKLDDELVDNAELHEAIDDLPWWNPIGWFSDSPVTYEQQVQCCDKIAKVYRDHGYLDVSVTGPERRPSVDDPEKIDVVFKVNEGQQYRIGESKIIGVTKYPVSVVTEKSNLPPAGTIASEKVLQEAAHRVEVQVGSGDFGLADTRVDIKRIPTIDRGTVNLIYKVTEGVPVVINEIKIRGNDYTMDKVIRREIALGPGDRMLADRAERSQKRLENLDYFSRVRYYLERTDLGKDSNGAEYRDLVYEVEEKNTGSFMVGVGASTVDSVYVSAEVNQNNFDIFAPTKLFRGAGQKGRIYVAWGPRYQSAEAGFVEPHLFGRLLELDVDVYRRFRWYDQYDLIRTGGQVALTYPVKFWPTWSAFGRLGLGLGAEYIEFDDVDNSWYNYQGRTSQYFVEQERKYDGSWEPGIHLFWSKDSRDNFRVPTRGHRSKIFGDIMPSSDYSYWRLGIDHRSYFNVWKRFSHVFMVRFRAETEDKFSGDDIPIYDRMFLGGPRSIRGIRYRNVSPLAERVGGGDWAPMGGQTLFAMNFEYTIPIVKMLRLAAFSDLGSIGESAWDLNFSSTFAWTVGLGVRLDIPMFPIRLDFGIPLKTPDHAEEEVFSFTVGYDF